MSKAPELGDIVEAYCQACRLNLDASVAALDGGDIKQVQCRTCGNFHAYKPPVSEEVRRERGIKRALNMRKKRMSPPPQATIKRGGRIVESTVRGPGAPGTPGGGPPATGTAPTRTENTEDDWRGLTEGVKSTQATIYRQSRRYAQGDFLIHRKLGLGYVKDVRTVDDEDWAVVVFRTQNDTLPMNRESDEF